MHMMYVAAKRGLFRDTKAACQHVFTCVSVHKRASVFALVRWHWD